MPASRHEQPGVTIKDLTDRIARTLDDFEALYVEKDKDEISLFKEVVQAVDGMDSGPLKANLRTFMNTFENISDQLDNMIKDRDSVIDTMAQVMTSIPPVVGTSEKIDDKTLRHRMLFKQIQALNEEISNLQGKGKNTTQLRRERDMLQRQAVSEYNNFKQAEKDIEEQIILKVDHSAWKFAASEIVSLLSKTRNGNMTYIVELEQKIQEFVKDTEKANNLNQKYRVQLAEMRGMEKEWKDKYIKINKEKMKYDQILRQQKEQIKQLRNVLKGNGLDLPESVITDDFIKSDDDQDQQYPAFANEDEVEKKLEDLTNEFNKTKEQLAESKKNYLQMKQRVSTTEKLNNQLEKKMKEKDQRIKDLENDTGEFMSKIKDLKIQPEKLQIPPAPEQPLFEGPLSESKKISAPEPVLTISNNNLPMIAKQLTLDEKTKDSSNTALKEKGVFDGDKCNNECKIIINNLQTKVTKLEVKLDDQQKELQKFNEMNDTFKDISPERKLRKFSLKNENVENISRLSIDYKDTSVQTDHKLDLSNSCDSILTNEYRKETIPTASVREFQDCSKNCNIQSFMLQGEDPRTVQAKSLIITDLLKRETDRIVVSVEEYVDFMKHVVEENLISMGNANDTLMGLLSEDQKQAMNRTNKDLSDNQLCEDERCQYSSTRNDTGTYDYNSIALLSQVKDIANGAIESLKQAYKNVYNNLINEHERYDLLHSEIESFPKFPLDDERLKSSTIDLNLQTPRMGSLPRIPNQSRVTNLEAIQKVSETQMPLPDVLMYQDEYQHQNHNRLKNKESRSRELIMINTPNHEKKKFAKKRGLIELTIFGKEEKTFTTWKSKENSKNRRTSNVYERRKAIDSELSDVLGDYFKDFTPEDVHHSLNDYTAKIVKRERKKQIENAADRFLPNEQGRRMSTETAHSNTIRPAPSSLLPPISNDISSLMKISEVSKSKRRTSHQLPFVW